LHFATERFEYEYYSKSISGGDFSYRFRGGSQGPTETSLRWHRSAFGSVMRSIFASGVYTRFNLPFT
jgi:hypothetical protein